MYKLYIDKEEIFECTLNLYGASLKNTFVRLVVESGDVNFIFKGEIDKKGTAKVPVKQMRGLLDEGTTGKMTLEVVADDTFFTPWESDYQVDLSKKVQVEVKEQDTPIIQENKKKITVSEVKNEPKSDFKLNKHVRGLSKVMVSKGINANTIVDKVDIFSETLTNYVLKHKITSSTEMTPLIEHTIEVLNKIKK